MLMFFLCDARYCCFGQGSVQDKVFIAKGVVRPSTIRSQTSVGLVARISNARFAWMTTKVINTDTSASLDVAPGSLSQR